MKHYYKIIYVFFFILSTSVYAQNLKAIESEDLILIENKITKLNNIITTLSTIKLEDLKDCLTSIEFEIFDVRVLIVKLTIKYGRKAVRIYTEKLIVLIDELRVKLIVAIPNLSAEFVILLLNLTDEQLCVDYTKKKLLEFKKTNLLSEEIHKEYYASIYLYGDSSNIFCEQGMKCLKAMRKLKVDLETYYKSNTPTLIVKDNCVSREPVKLTRDRFIHILRRHLELYFVMDNLNNTLPSFFEVKSIKDLELLIKEIFKEGKLKSTDRDNQQPIFVATILYDHKLYSSFIKKTGYYVDSIHPKRK